jgi:hypothetical protein
MRFHRRSFQGAHNPAESPYFSCTCGVYAAKTIEHLRQCGYKRFGLFGEVYMWGKVVEHERGWRAQFAYPKTLFLAAETIPFSLSEINAPIKTLAEFGTDIFLLHDRERVAHASAAQASTRRDWTTLSKHARSITFAANRSAP